MGEVHVGRVYDDARPQDGNRVLVDGLWPRGVSKADAHLGEWLKTVAPSPELRRWFGHSADKFAEFGRRYRAELAAPVRAEAVMHLKQMAQAGKLTILTATRNPECSHAAVLADLLAQGQDPDASPEGGDPACWLHLVCTNCGAVAESDPPTTCTRCQAEISG